MARIHSTDPRVPQRKKSTASGVSGSIAAIFLMLFALGYLPQINQFFSDTNSSLQANNDAIVNQIIAATPMALVAIGGLGIAAIVFTSIFRRPAAKSTQPKQA